MPEKKSGCDGLTPDNVPIGCLTLCVSVTCSGQEKSPTDCSVLVKSAGLVLLSEQLEQPEGQKFRMRASTAWTYVQVRGLDCEGRPFFGEHKYRGLIEDASVAFVLLDCRSETG